LSEDRHSHAEVAQLLSDPIEIARREAENGLRQFNLAIQIIGTHVKDSERLGTDRFYNCIKPRSTVSILSPARFETRQSKFKEAYISLPKQHSLPTRYS
jgi:hypothetical protein